VSKDRPEQSRRSRRKKWLIGAAIIAVLVVAFVAYSFSESYRLEVKDYTYAGPDVPAAFDGTRIVLLADVHRSFYFSQERLGRLVDRVEGLHPDLIVLGGDYVYGSKDYEQSAFAALGRLHAPLGVYAVLGNHDYAHPGGGVSDPGRAIQAITGANITLLDNSGVWIEKSGRSFRLAGVSDLQQGHPDAAPGLSGTVPRDLVVLASHEPDFAEKLPPGAVDLVLSGHTHGGQVTFFGLWAPVVGSKYSQKYRTGLVNNGTTTVVVSNGIGTIFPPLRFFAPPQIVVVTLKRAG
jgi:uncharacterized protein